MANRGSLSRRVSYADLACETAVRVVSVILSAAAAVTLDLIPIAHC